MKKLKKILLHFTLSVTLISLMLCSTACSTNSSGTEGSSGNKTTDLADGDIKSDAENEAGESAPTEIRFFRVAVTQDPTKDRVLLELQKQTNTKIEFVTAPWDQEATKVSTILASGEVIDIISINQGITDYARNESLIQIDNYLTDVERYPILNTIATDKLFEKYKVDEQIYAIPCLTQPGGGWVAGIRKDWLDNLELEVPKTTDEMYEVFRAFKEDDPDGNGIDDTIGMTTAYIFDSWKVFQDAYSSPADWVIDEETGNITYRRVSSQNKETLKYAKKMLDNGLLNEDIFTIKDRDLCLNDFVVGKCGIGFSPMWAKTLSDLVANNPEAEVELLYPTPHDPEYTNGAITSTTGWNWMLNVLPKTCRNPERALDLLEYLQSSEGRKLMCVGIEGIHYERCEDDSVFYGINQEEQNKDWDPKDGEGPTGYPLWWGLVSTINGVVDFDKYRGNLAEGLRNCTTFVSEEDFLNNPFYEQRKLITTIPGENPVNFINETYVTYEGKLNSIREEYEARLLLESADNFDAIWEEFVEQMNANGLEESTVVAQEWYDENN